MSEEEAPAVQQPPPNWLGRAWDDYIDCFPRLLPVVLALVLLNVPTFLIVDRWHSYVPALAYMGLLVTPFSTGANLAFIRAVRREPGVFQGLFGAFPVYGRALAVAAALGAMTLGGTLLFILPGAVLYCTYCFSEYAVVDKRTGIRDSFVFSSTITDGARIPVFFLVVMLVLVEIMVPNPVYVAGSLSAPLVKTDLRAWVLTAFFLKTLAFAPWLRLAMARAYVELASVRRLPDTPAG